MNDTKKRVSYSMRRLRRHLLLALFAAVFTAVAYACSPGDWHHRLSMGCAYTALALLAWSLWLGPLHVLRARPNPVSFDGRRDVSIWAGLLALFHTGVGLTVHLRGRMWMYFFKRLHPVKIQNNQFGFANYVGLLAGLLFLMLLVLSNDVALRALGTRRWKSLQRWSYLAFALTIAHGIAFQLVEKRQVPWVLLFALLAVAAIGVQLAGFLRTRARSKMQLRA